MPLSRARRLHLPWIRLATLAITLGALISSVSLATQSEGGRRVPSERLIGTRSAALVAAERALRSAELPTAPALRIALPEFRAPALEQAPMKGRLQVGVHRDLIGTQGAPVRGAELDWEAAIGGGLVATIGVVSPGAGAMRVALRAHELPLGTELRFYGPGDAQTSYGPFGADLLVSPVAERTDEPGDDLFWSPVIEGPEVGIEIWVTNAAAAAAVEIGLPTLSHLSDSPLAERSLNHLNNSQGCEKDIACSKKWLDVADSVAKIIFESGGGTFLCTGTLVSDTDESDQRLLFITAAHCISKKAEAKSATFYWFFQRAKCRGDDPASVEQTSGGANLRYTSKFQAGVETTDTTLMELRKSAPDDVVLSGWDIADADKLTNKTVWGIHHPSGDVKMGSKGKLVDQVQVVPSSGGGFFIFGGEPLTHHEIVWKKGVTEGGSSGSGIWYGNKFPNQFLVGWLSGGLSFCSAPKDPDYYGRLSEAYQVKKFRKHLDPENARLQE